MGPRRPRRASRRQERLRSPPLREPAADLPARPRRTHRRERAIGGSPEHGSTSFHDIDIAWTEVWHPGGCSAFRLSAGGRSVVFTGDVELPFTDRAALAEFTEGADTLICDAQYSAEQYERHVRWGHSSNIDAARFAADAGVDRLILTHHDPMHDDEAIDRLVEQAREVFPRVDAARHGMHVIGS